MKDRDCKRRARFATPHDRIMRARCRARVKLEIMTKIMLLNVESAH